MRTYKEAGNDVAKHHGLFQAFEHNSSNAGHNQYQSEVGYQSCGNMLFGAVSAAGTDVLSEADSTAAGVDTEAWKKLSRVGRLVKFI